MNDPQSNRRMAPVCFMIEILTPVVAGHMRCESLYYKCPLWVVSGHSDEDQLRSGSARIDVMRVFDLFFDHGRRKGSLATMRALSSQNHDDVVKPQP